MLDGSLGLQLKEQSFTTAVSGKMSAKARTIVVLPEPFGPRINTPPILGLIAFIKTASLSLSKPTMAEKGKRIRLFN